MAKQDPYELPPPRRRRGSDDASLRRASRRARRLRNAARGRGGSGSRGPATSRIGWQRSTVKVSFQQNSASGKWRAHGRYIGREASRPDPENKGRGFNSEREDVHVSNTLGEWEKDGDARLWKVVVSPENGVRMDLQQHARDLVEQMENELSTRLSWVGVEHDHSDHPHVHLAIRGIDEEGEPLRLSREFVTRRIREMSRELATAELGSRTAGDHFRAREAGVAARYVGMLDRGIDEEAGADRRISFHHEPAQSHPRHQVWRRLEFLEGLGLAVRERNTWIVASDHLNGLRDIQRARDIHRASHDPEISLTDPKPNPRFTRLAPGQTVTGRFAGTSLDEGNDRVRVWVEGTDGHLHLIQETPRIAAARQAGRLRRGTIVTLRGVTFTRDDDSTGTFVAHRDHGDLDELRSQSSRNVLDETALRSIAESGQPPEPSHAPSRFANHFQEAARSRLAFLVASNLAIEVEDEEAERSYRLAQGVQIEMDDRGQARTPMNELRRESTKPVHEAGAAAGQKIRGEFTGYAEDSNGQPYAVLDAGSRLVAVPTEQTGLQVGQEYEAQSHSERDGERRRVLSWQLQDIERMREQARGHER